MLGEKKMFFVLASSPQSYTLLSSSYGDLCLTAPEFLTYAKIRAVLQSMNQIVIYVIFFRKLKLNGKNISFTSFKSVEPEVIIYYKGILTLL